MTWQISFLIAILAGAWLCFFVLDLSMETPVSEPVPAARHLHVVQSDVPSGVRAIQDAGPYDWATEADGGAA